MSEQRERTEITPGTLLACPFCGGQPKATRLMGYDYWKTEITCCGFTGIDYDDAIVKRWNTRKVNNKVEHCESSACTLTVCLPVDAEKNAHIRHRIASEQDAAFMQEVDKTNTRCILSS
jgi:hypothetical protein